MSTKYGGLWFALLLASGCAWGPPIDLDRTAARSAAVDAYLAEFCSPAFQGTRIGEAIHDVLMKVPSRALVLVLDRRRPVLFTEVYDAGTARFASSSEVIMTPQDRPAFQQGMTILKLNMSLNDARSVDAVKGIVAHELAHRVLDHVRKGHVSCDAEREANRLIKTWGFEKALEAASQEFGHGKTGGPASCQEK